MTASKSKALETIKALANQHHLRLDEIAGVLSESKTLENRTEQLMRLFAYLGGIFIFSGLSIYIGTFWGVMNTFTKILLTLGTGSLLYLLAILLPEYQKKHESMMTPLFFTAAIFQTIGLFISVAELKDGLNFKMASTLIFMVMLVQQGLTFRKTNRSGLIFTTLFFWCAFFSSALDLVHASDKLIGILVGLSTLGIAYGLQQSAYKTMASFWYFIGSVLFLNGLFDLLRNTWVELLFFVVIGLMLYISTIIKNRTLLFVSTLSSLAYIGYFTSKHFMHSTAWPIMLVVLGFVCFGVGVLVLKLCKKYGI